MALAKAVLVSLPWKKTKLFPCLGSFAPSARNLLSSTLSYGYLLPLCRRSRNCSFSNMSGHQNHLEGLLNTDCWAHPQSLWFRGIGYSLRICISGRFAGDTEGASPGSTAFSKHAIHTKACQPWQILSLPFLCLLHSTSYTWDNFALFTPLFCSSPLLKYKLRGAEPCLFGSASCPQRLV